MKTLLAIDYRQLLCIHLPKGIVATDRRRAGMKRVCREAGVDFNAMFHRYLLPGECHHADTVGIAGYYPRGACPMLDAVVYGNDRAVLVVYQLLLGRGLRIPRDVIALDYDSMVGTGESSLPPLSTIQLPHCGIGRLSMLHLTQGLDHRDIVWVDSPWFSRVSV